MTNIEELPDDVPFSISCYDCDCDGPATMDQALAEGWTRIQYTPDGAAENFLGMCPEHTAELEAELAAERLPSAEPNHQTGD